MAGGLLLLRAQVIERLTNISQQDEVRILLQEVADEKVITVLGSQIQGGDLRAKCHMSRALTKYGFDLI